MTEPDNYRRPAFPHRPWITGKLWDDYSRNTVLHLDAYTFVNREYGYLALYWSEGGFKAIALDGYRIEPDGLTPVEGHVTEALRTWGAPRYWTRSNNAVMARLHRTVLEQPARMLDLGRGRWSRVVVQAHL